MIAWEGNSISSRNFTCESKIFSFAQNFKLPFIKLLVSNVIPFDVPDYDLMI